MRCLLLVAAFCSLPVLAETVTVDELLGLISDNSEITKVIDTNLQAEEAEIRARDQELSTIFSAEAAAADENRRTLSSNPHSLSRYFDLGVTKPFETGTTVSARGGYEWAESDLISGHRHVMDWEVEASQSLLRNGFGEATRLRRTQDAFEIQSAYYDALFDRQVLLVDVEALYWDMALIWKEEQILKDNIERGRRIEQWINKRIRLSAAEPVDLLQIQTLIADRQLNLDSLQDRKQAIYSQLEVYSDRFSERNWQPDLNELEQARSLSNLIATKNQSLGSSNPERIEVLAQELRAARARVQVQRVNDELKPDLEAFARYGQNGVRDGFGDSLGETIAPRYSGSAIGLRLSMSLDKNMQDERRRASELTAAAADIELRLRQREASVDWNELQRRLKSYDERVERARELSKLNTKKIQSERQRYEQGRSTAFQVINFEVDAANAELTVYRLLNEARKLESLARFFASRKELAQ